MPAATTTRRGQPERGSISPSKRLPALCSQDSCQNALHDDDTDGDDGAYDDASHVEDHVSFLFMNFQVAHILKADACLDTG